jgi:tetrahydromethanopterin S-methyltransferase subunit B
MNSLLCTYLGFAEIVLGIIIGVSFSSLVWFLLLKRFYMEKNE